MMDTFWIHVGIGVVACLLTANMAYRAGRDRGKEITEIADKEIYNAKFKMLDQRIQELKKSR
jgi:hypothetical protein